MAAMWPVLKRRLLVVLPLLDGWSEVVVFSGPPVTQDDPADYVTVGFVPGEDFAGSYEQTDLPGGLVEETGTIRSELVCATGDVDLATVETRAFDLVDAWQEEIRRDSSLGVLTCGGAATLAVDVEPKQAAGSAQRLTVTLSYTSRS